MKADLSEIQDLITQAQMRLPSRKAIPFTLASPPRDDGGASFLIMADGMPCARLINLPVDRERIPPGIADGILSQIQMDLNKRDAIQQAYDKVASEFAGLSSMLPASPLIVLQGEYATLHAPFSAYTGILTHSLQRRWIRTWRIGAQNASRIADGMIMKEAERAKMLNAAGSRHGALMCCPVAQVAIIAEPGEWASRILRDAGGSAGGLPFLDGLYRPMILLAKGIRWRAGTLMLDQEMPETMRIAVEGRMLSDLIVHPLLPPDARITATARRQSDGQIYVRTDAAPVPFGPILDRIGITDADLPS